jgi:hypothetical protein
MNMPLIMPSDQRACSGRRSSPGWPIVAVNGLLPSHGQLLCSYRQAWFGVVDELTGNASAGRSKWRRVTQDASIVGRVHSLNP